jgi:tetratricopeptide (TPR) repeat protein
LPPFTKAEASSLFYSYAQQLNLDVISKDDATYFIEKLCATPGLLFKAVKAINDSGLRDAKRNINILLQEAERTLRTLIKEVVNNNQDMKDLIVLLATYELLSEPVLKDIFSDRIDEYNSNIDKLTTESLIYSFGPSEQYFILDNAIADYVRRARWELSKDIVDHVENVILHHIDGDGTLTGDVSMYLYSVKNQLLSGKVTNQNLLMPSVAIKAIISLYDSRKWENVVELSDKVLTESYYNRIDPEAVREIKYWLCLALCRLGNDRVKGEIINANFEQHDQEFLKGFWCRNTGQYEQAVKHYRKTIEIAGDINKAKRELVTSLLALRKYDEALDLAKSNYEKGSDNPYHIHAYFRCLVRQRHISPENHRVLQDLIEEMKNLENKKAESFYDSMVLEYNYRVDNHHQIISILQEADKLKRKWSKSNAVLRTVNEIYAERKIEALKFYTEDDFVE